MTEPLLVLGWGNPSRGDDALGPLFIERLQAMVGPDAFKPERRAERTDGGGTPRVTPARVAWLTDFQLQVEHALDLVGRERVLFVDAGSRCAAPFEVSAVLPARDASFTTHAMTPAAVLQVLRDIGQGEPPPCSLLLIRGEQFELGAPLSDAASAHLEAALAWAMDWLQPPGG
jgi:hydrogenase maturation protease